MITVLTLLLGVLALVIPCWGLLMTATGEITFERLLDQALAISSTLTNLAFVVLGALYALGWIG